MADGDEIGRKKVSDLALSEVIDQLQILEYMATNTPQGLTDGDRRFREELEAREKLLVSDRSTDPKLEDLEKDLADRQARESHDLALKQTAELNRFGPSQELTDRHREEWEEQTKDFATERERYIVDFTTPSACSKRCANRKSKKPLSAVLNLRKASASRIE